MKCFLIAVTAVFLACFPSFASDGGDRLNLNLESWQNPKLVGKLPQGWIRNSKFPDGSGALVEVDGKSALKLVGSPSDKKLALHVYYRTPFDVQKDDVILTKGKVRGSGEFSVMLYCYDEEDKNTGVLPVEHVLQPVSSADFREFEVNIPITVLKKSVPAKIRYALGVAPDTDVEIADLEVRHIPASK